MADDQVSSPTIDHGTATAEASVTGERREIGSKLVDRFALWSGVAGLIPIPFVDAVAVGGLQIELLRRLSHLYDVPFSENSGKALIASLAGTMIPTTSGIGAASMLKSVPVIGTITAAFVMPVLSSGATFAIGRAFIQHFESGGTLLDFNPPDYREFLRNQKELWDLRRKKNLPAETTATPPEGQTPGGATTA
jgi:uncharacterized protein (DUF697 family)